MRPARSFVVAALLAATGCSAGGSSHVVTQTSAGTTTTQSSSASSTPLVRLHVRAVGQLADPVSRAVAVDVGQRIVVLGGLTTGDVTTGRVVTINPNRWSSAISGQLRQPVHDASGAALAGRPVVFGGGSSTEVGATQQWTSGTSRIIGALPGPRSDSAAATIGSTAYVVGGFDGSRMARAVLATTNGRSFHAVARLRQGVRYPAVAAFGGAIYVFGGELATTEGTSTGGQTRSVQRIDPSTGQTRLIGRLPWGIGHAMAFTLDGQLYLAGGRRGTQATARIWRVNPATARLTSVGRLPQAISDSAVVTIGVRTVALIGGETTGPYAPQGTVVVIRTP